MRFRRAVALMVCAPLVIGGTTACVARTAPEPSVSSLVVHNRSFFDVNVYSVASVGSLGLRLGTVAGTSSATFPLRTRDLQAGGVLVVMVHAVGAWGSWTSDAVNLGDGIVAVLDVSTDPFGDCSTSSLHTMLVRDTLSSPRG